MASVENLAERTETREFTAAAAAVVALCFLLNAVARGLSETFAVFYGEFLREFDWSRAEISSIYSVAMVAIGVTAPLVGAVFDRLGGRVVYAGGLFAYALGFFVASRMGALWQGWIGLGLLVGIGAAATGMTPATGMLARWFDRRLGTATGIAYAGLAVGTMVLAPLARLMIEIGGWRWTYARFALALVLLGLVVLALPWRRLDAGAAGAKRRTALLPARVVFTRAAFWGMFLVFFAGAVVTYGIQVQAVVYLEEVGYPPLVATFAYGFTSFLALVGILGAGWLADRIGRRRVAAVSFTASILGIIALGALAATGPNLALLALFLLLFGTSMGSRGPLVSSLVPKLFPDQAGVVFGAVLLGMGTGAAFGSWITGWLHGATGGYTAGFAVSIGAAILGMAQFWLVPELRTGRWRGRAP